MSFLNFFQIGSWTKQRRKRPSFLGVLKPWREGCGREGEGDTWGTSGSLCRRQVGPPGDDTFPACPQRGSHFPPVPWARSWAAVWVVCLGLQDPVGSGAFSLPGMKRSKGARGLCGDCAHRERPPRLLLWVVFAFVFLSFTSCSSLPLLFLYHHVHSRMPSPHLCLALSCPLF